MVKMGSKTTVLGIMSGSSLDGLDLCTAAFEKRTDAWTYEIMDCQTIEIPKMLMEQLECASTIDSIGLLELDIKYGEWIGQTIKNLKHRPDLIGVHGHTVFHLPEKGISHQVGNGGVINFLAGVRTVTDFRNLDIQLGGQGAPLVPMGEKHLFPEFDGFLNLGGICNGSFRNDSGWIAGDIGPFNQVFNYFSRKLGHDFDESGRLAASGQVIRSLLDDWNSIDYFRKPFPKSLGNQWVEDHFIKEYDSLPEDILRTFSLFIAQKTGEVLKHRNPRKVMATGGGAYNTFLIDQIKSLSKVEIVIPDQKLIEFKEALIFGFLGLLRQRNEPNVLASCTGASQDSSSGVIYSSSQNV